MLSERLGLKMQLGPHTRLIYQCKLYSWIALFFLLFTLADISSPRQCCEELGGLPDFAARAATVNASAVAEATPSDEATYSIANDDSQPTQPATPCSTDEDCFCCCSHVLPGLSFSMAVTQFKSPEADPQQDCLLTPALRALYHPPRFV